MLFRLEGTVGSTLRVASCLALATVFFAHALGPRAAAAASIISIGTGPATAPRAATSASDLSGDGSTVVGVLAHNLPTDDCSPSERSGFVWTEARGMTLIDAPEGFRLDPTSVSYDGRVVVGNLTGHETSPDEAFRWTESGGLESLGTGAAYGVSADGAYVFGSISTSSPYYYDIPVDVNTDPHAPPVPVDQRLIATEVFSASADLSAFTGSAAFSPFDGPTVFRLEPGSTQSPLPILPAGYDEWISYGTRISADGSTIVGPINGPPYSREDNRTEAFVWREGEPLLPLGYVGIDLSDHPESWARDVSGDGSVVVGYSYTADDVSAFVWTEETGMQSLEVLLTQAGVDLGDWELHDIAGISDDGRTLVATGLDGVAFRSFLVVIPEPGTGLLLSLGLSFMAHHGRRSRNPSFGTC